MVIWNLVTPREASPLGVPLVGIWSSHARVTSRKSSLDDRARFGLDAVQMVAAQKTLGVQLVDLLGTGRASREPSILGDHLEPADGCIVAGRTRQHGGDLLSGELGGAHPLGRQAFEDRLLLGRGGRVDALVGGVAKLARELAIEFAGVAARDRRHLRGQKAEDDAVF